MPFLAESLSRRWVIHSRYSILFSFTIALATYFKKTIRSDEIASSSSVSFTINHIAAVFLPFLLGLLWVSNYQIVFFLRCCYFLA